MALEVGEREGASRRREIARDGACDIAAVEIVQARAREPLEGRGEARIAEARSRRGRGAVDEIRGIESRLAAQPAQLRLRGGGLAAGDRDAFTRMVDRIGEEAR